MFLDMRLFLYEYATAQPFLDVPESIRREGRAMFDALRRDALAIPNLELLTLECPFAAEERMRFQSLAAKGDWSLIIAPETEGILLERCRWVDEAGGRFLGPTAEAIQRTGDKWETYLAWTKWGIKTAETWLGPSPLKCQRVVRKLREGAGSQGMEIVHPRQIGTVDPRWLFQEYIPGQAVSFAVLIDPVGNRLPLLPASQHLAQDGSFRYLGGSLPVDASLTKRVISLAMHALDAIPGLCGFVGVDLVLGENTDGSQDYAIEINPRLTTSYVGLRTMAEDNLLGLLLDMAAGREVLPIRWKQGHVTFDALGQVQWLT